MNNQVTIAEIISKAEQTMEGRGYIAESMRIYRRYWNEFSSYSQKENIEYFSVDIANEYLKSTLNYPEETSNKKQVQDHVRAIKRLVEVHLYGCIMTRGGIKNQETISKFSEATTAYEKYCKKRNNSDETITRGKNSLHNFYYFLVSKEIDDVNKITPKNISEFISTKLCYSKKGVYRHTSALKSFFKSIYLAGLSDKDMSQDMPKMNIPNADFSPPIWNEEQLSQILSCIDCGNAVGKRDYAMLLLVARLGIRDSDLRNLKLSNINWEAKSIAFTQLKTKQSLTLPLLEDVGWAIIEYLKNGRPKTTCQNIFVNHIQPYGEMKLCFYKLKKYINSAGITVNSDKSKGIHSLRHTLVNRLLEKNVPMDTISTILGHTSDNSIKSYLHTDIKTLRLCALEVSEVTTNE